MRDEEKSDVEDGKELSVDGVERESVVDEVLMPTESVVPEPVYLEGFKLYSVLAAVTLAIFLMMLDTSIIVTVDGSLSSNQCVC